MSNNLLRLLAQAHPERDQADLLAMLSAIPDAKAAKPPTESTSARLRRGTIFPPRKLQRPASRLEALARRRRLATSGPLPPALAARFTTGESAVLRIVGDDWREHGACTACYDAIAARAGVCRSLARNAIKLAGRFGVLSIEERRRPGQRNLPNVVKVIDRDWKAWLERGPKAKPTETGGKKIIPTEIKSLTEKRAQGSRHYGKSKRAGQSIRDPALRSPSASVVIGPCRLDP